MHGEFTFLADLGLIFTVAVLLALLLGRMGLPPVLGYLATGAVLGPAGLGFVHEEHEAVKILAELGVVLLLFTIGLEFSLDDLRRSWRSVLLGGGAQVGLTVAGTAGVAVALGRTWPQAVAWGFLVALSSTAVVLRMLDMRGESFTPHGRLALGVLIFQDLCVVPMMLILPVLAGQRGGGIVGVLIQALVTIVAIGVASKLVVPTLMRRIALSRNREVFLLAVLAIAGLTAYATSLTGLSLALGAFLAGMVLADTEYSHQALADVVPLRAIMMAVFFVSVGLLLDPMAVAEAPLQVLLLLGAIIGGKLLLNVVTLLLLRVPVRTAAITGASLAQVGEFSLVLGAAAVGVGLLSAQDESRFLAATVISIVLTPLWMAIAPSAAEAAPMRWLERRLEPIGAPGPEVGRVHHEVRDHVVVAGLGVGGKTVVEALERLDIPVAIVELNPDTVHLERERGRHVVYGDASDSEVLRHVGVERASALVVVVNDSLASHRAVEAAHRLRPDLPVILRTRYTEEEGLVRRPSVDVLSEEYAGSLAVTALLLRRLEIRGWSRLIELMVARHERLPALEEPELGPPPGRDHPGSASPEEAEPEAGPDEAPPDDPVPRDRPDEEAQ